MATLKEKLESLKPEELAELKEALGMPKEDKGDFAAMMSKLSDRITALEKPKTPTKKKSWFESFWDGE